MSGRITLMHNWYCQRCANYLASQEVTEGGQFGAGPRKHTVCGGEVIRMVNQLRPPLPIEHGTTDLGIS